MASFDVGSLLDADNSFKTLNIFMSLLHIPEFSVLDDDYFFQLFAYIS